MSWKLTVALPLSAAFGVAVLGAQPVMKMTCSSKQSQSRAQRVWLYLFWLTVACMVCAACHDGQSRSAPAQQQTHKHT